MSKVIGIYDNTPGFCIDSAKWVIKKKFESIDRSSESTEHELTIPIQEFGDNIHCLGTAVEVLKAEGWRINKHYIVVDNVHIFVEL